MSSTTIKRYALTDKRNAGSTKPNDYITRDTREELEQHRKGEWETPIVELDITFNFPEPELPTTPGSLIRASITTEWDGTNSVLLALSDDTDSEPWYVITAPYTGEYYPAHEFSNVAVLFDAATVSA